eukprot:4309691-Pyramimonas_sp.AAC.1
MKYPQWISVWRPSEQPLCNCRVPFLGGVAGLTVSGSLAIDYMRAICLGVFHSIMLEAFWGAPECPGM